MVKIGAGLPKLSTSKSGYPFLDHPVFTVQVLTGHVTDKNVNIIQTHEDTEVPSAWLQGRYRK